MRDICSSIITETSIVTGIEINLYMEEYVRLTNTGGNTRSNTNWYFAARLAALNLLSYKKECGFNIQEGFVYAISNPAWEGKLKIGTTWNPYVRLSQFQTYSPLRDYKLEHWSFFSDKFYGERLVHRLFGSTRDHEWFSIPDTERSNHFKEIKAISKELMETRWEL